MDAAIVTLVIGGMPEAAPVLAPTYRVSAGDQCHARAGRIHVITAFGGEEGVFVFADCDVMIFRAFPDYVDLYPRASWSGLSRPSTSAAVPAKTWMPGTSPGMTEKVRWSIISGNALALGRWQTFFMGGRRLKRW
jgi:hypothetical protein